MLNKGSKIYYIDYEESEASYTIIAMQFVKNHEFYPDGILYTVHSDSFSQSSGYYPMHEYSIDKEDGRFFTTPEKAHDAYEAFLKQKSNLRR